MINVYLVKEISLISYINFSGLYAANPEIPPPQDNYIAQIKDGKIELPNIPGDNNIAMSVIVPEEVAVFMKEKGIEDRFKKHQFFFLTDPQFDEENDRLIYTKLNRIEFSVASPA